MLTDYTTGPLLLANRFILSHGHCIECTLQLFLEWARPYKILEYKTKMRAGAARRSYGGAGEQSGEI